MQSIARVRSSLVVAFAALLSACGSEPTTSPRDVIAQYEASQALAGERQALERERAELAAAQAELSERERALGARENRVATREQALAQDEVEPSEPAERVEAVPREVASPPGQPTTETAAQGPANRVSPLPAAAGDSVVHKRIAKLWKRDLRKWEQLRGCKLSSGQRMDEAIANAMPERERFGGYVRDLDEYHKRAMQFVNGLEQRPRETSLSFERRVDIALQEAENALAPVLTSYVLIGVRLRGVSGNSWEDEVGLSVTMPSGAEDGWSFYPIKDEDLWLWEHRNTPAEQRDDWQSLQKVQEGDWAWLLVEATTPISSFRYEGFEVNVRAMIGEGNDCSGR